MISAELLTRGGLEGSGGSALGLCIGKLLRAPRRTIEKSKFNATTVKIQIIYVLRICSFVRTIFIIPSFTDSDQDDFDEEEIVVLFNATGERCLCHVSAWARSWFWDSSVRVGIEVDMYRGSVTWSLNGIMGPRTPLGDNWERGVDISVAGVSNEIIYSDDDAEKERATIYVRSNRLPRGMHLLEHGNGFCRARDITTGVSCFCGHEEWLRKCLANCEELK